MLNWFEVVTGCYIHTWTLLPISGQFGALQQHWEVITALTIFFELFDGYGIIFEKVENLIAHTFTMRTVCFIQNTVETINDLMNIAKVIQKC